MRQPNLSQHLPNYVDIGDELYSIIHQGKHEMNWLVIHTSYLDL